jgi:hypothetical protein
MDPHVSGGWVSYTDDAAGLLAAHYYNMATGQDASIDSNGGNDSLSGVSGTVVYNHKNTSGNSPSMPTTLAAATPRLRSTPQPNAFVLSPAIGGDPGAWDDFTVNPTYPQIMVEDLAGRYLPRLRLSLARPTICGSKRTQPARVRGLTFALITNFRYSVGSLGGIVRRPRFVTDDVG